jgi:RNA polymerase sigma-70 factor (ECF subfamily)
MLKDPAEAEDLTQEAFVAAFEQIGSFRGESAFSTWLYRIAVRRSLNRIRDLGRRPLAHASSLDDPPSDGAPSLDVADPSPGPDVIRERRETRAALERGLLALSADFRVVLVLREMRVFRTRRSRRCSAWKRGP